MSEHIRNLVARCYNVTGPIGLEPNALDGQNPASEFSPASASSSGPVQSQTPAEVIQNLVGAKDISINKFNIDTIHYQLSIYGSFNSLLKEISENNFLQVIDVYEESSSIHLSFQK